MDSSSNLYPTSQNPLVLKYKGHVPALKNNRELRKDKNGGYQYGGKNTTVENWLKRVAPALTKQWLDSGFPMMKNIPVAAWVDIYFFGKSDLVNADVDNAYTTIQETWQLPNSRAKSAGITGSIYDDRQVVQGTFNLTITPIRSLEGAVAYLWAVSNEKPYYLQLIDFLHWYHLNKHQEKEYVEMPDFLQELLDFDTGL